MKKITYAGMAALMLSVSILGTGCFGKFALVRKIYTWNDSLGNKVVKTLVYYALNIIPVYGVAGFIDFVVLNLIEFWSGSNPIAMKPGDKETQIVQKDGRRVEITATQNRFDIKDLEGANAGKVVSMVYNPEDASWSYVDAQNDIKLFSYAGNNMVKIYKPDGGTVLLPADMNNGGLVQSLIAPPAVFASASK